MKGINNKNLWHYVGRFTLIHIINYSVIATLFLIFQNALPASERIALELFKPYRPIGIMTIFTQGIRGAVLALILYPFYDIIVRGKRGYWVLFGALWGLALLGSVEPMPGSIEGMIYTETTFTEHLSILIAGAIQILSFSWIFLRWETWRYTSKNSYKTGGVSHE